MANEVRLIELPRATPLDGPYRWAYDGMYEVEKLCDLAEFGHADLTFTPQESAALAAHNSHILRRRAVLVKPPSATSTGAPVREATGRVLGRALLELPLAENTHTAEMHVQVRPDCRQQGLGTQLLQWAETTARGEGRTTGISWIDFADTDNDEDGAEPRVVAPDGGGSLPTEHVGWRFAHHRAWALQLIERLSVLDLPLAEPLLDGLLAEARGHAEGYRLQTWVDDVPEQLLADYGDLMRTVSADAPHGGLDVNEETWDADRAAKEFELMRAMGRTALVTGAIDQASGALAAMTVMSCPPETDPAMFQWETAVARRHRGHRLGMWIKAATLKTLAETRPAAQRVYTWNAEQNDHMLAINVALGFHPAGGNAAVQKNLDEVGHQESEAATSRSNSA